jgi:hypothetical protein
MARAQHNHIQTRAEVMTPHTQYDAFEAWCQAQRKQGVDSNEETKSSDDDSNGDEDQDDPEDSNIIENRVLQDTTEMFKHVLLFSQGVAKALYDNQRIMSLDVLQEPRA